MFWSPVKCAKGHENEVIKADLSKAYNIDVPHYQVRCKVPRNTCCFSDYFPSKAQAINSWNTAIKEGR